LDHAFTPVVVIEIKTACTPLVGKAYGKSYSFSQIYLRQSSKASGVLSRAVSRCLSRYWSRAIPHCWGLTLGR